ncbi:lactonase family protein [Roseiconus nitratireducens]|nr:lactonase family protein [Roseiconus nitratireducens]
MSAFASPATAESVDVWFGTTTPREGPSKGIYHATFDTESGKLSPAELAAEIDGPGFLAKHPGGTMLYAAASDNGKPSIVAYRIERQEDQTRLVKDSSVETGDGGAAHVSVSRDGKVVLSAQYGGGSTAAYRLAPNGSLLERSDLEKHPEGSGVVAGRQEKAHAHWTGTSPDDRFAFVPDLGMDRVVIYKLNTDQGTLEPHGYGVCPQGGGPRHMKFDPSGERIYVLNELSLSVTVFNYDPEAGTMTAVQTVPTLSEAVKDGERFNSASEIRVHPTGKFVYSANRGNDTITVFSVLEPSGQLRVIQVQPIHGAWPRNFNLDPTGKWLLAAGRNTNSVTIFEIDPDSGKLQFTMDSVMVPTPICVTF